MVLFSIAGAREVRRSRAAARPAQCRVVPRPPPVSPSAKSQTSTRWRGELSEALNPSAVKKPGRAATVAGTALGNPGPNTHHGCSGGGSRPRTWQLSAAPQNSSLPAPDWLRHRGAEASGQQRAPLAQRFRASQERCHAFPRPLPFSRENARAEGFLIAQGAA